MSFRFKLTKRVTTTTDTKEARGCDSENNSSSEKKDIKKPKTDKLSTLDPPLRHSY